MHPFTLERPRDLSAAIALGARTGRNDAATEYIAGGTDMLQLLQENVRRPDRLVALAGLLDRDIDAGSERLRIGAGSTMAEVAAHPQVAKDYPLIAEALLNSASPQVRNQATIGGNLLQRTRCPYFRDVGYAQCNKRAPGSGCAAIGGENRWHAVLGTSNACIAAHASDLAVALVALDATLEVRGTGRQRTVAVADFHRLPGSTPHIETVLDVGEVIAAVEIPRRATARQCAYVKVRDRASFAHHPIGVYDGLSPAVAGAAVGCYLTACPDYAGEPRAGGAAHDALRNDAAQPPAAAGVGHGH